MSILAARRKRSALYLSIAGLVLIVAALSALSARDPDGVTIRLGMTLVTLGAATWLPWQALLPAIVAAWLGPNIGRNLVEDYPLFNVNMMLELPGLLGLAAVSSIARISLRDLESENVMLGMNNDLVGTDPITGVFEESQLRNSLEVELSRSRRFGRAFAFVLVGIDELRQRFDYRDQAVWQASFAATADLLRGTRTNVDRVYLYGSTGFALILPESGSQDVYGLVRRLRRVARKVKPSEGEPGGPLPAHYGATFFPTCATTVDDLIRRAEIALRIADNNANRVQLDGAAAPEMPSFETLRQHQPDGPQDEPEPVPAAEAGVTPVIPLHVTEVQTPAEPVTAPEAPGVEQDDAPANPVIDFDAPSRARLFAFRAPEPAVDIYNRDWQTEAPLSVIRRPHPIPRLIAGDCEPAVEEPAVQDVLSDALAQLDGTLELIRSMKQRSA